MTEDHNVEHALQSTDRVAATPRPTVFDGVRPASWWILGLTAVTVAGTLLFNNVVILQSPVPAFVVSLYRETSGLITATLIASFSTLVVTVIVIFGIGRVRPWDVGWRGPQFWRGLAVTLAFWIAMQVALAVICGLNGDDISLHAAWNRRSASAIIGVVLAQFFGTALVEETLIRGFFLTQFYLKAASVFRHTIAVAVAVFGSTLLFSALHLPNDLWVGHVRGPDLMLNQVGFVIFGLIASALFLVTRNLFVTVGLHAIVNAPAPIVETAQITVYQVWFGLTMLLLVTWWIANWLGARRNRPRDDATMRASASGSE